MSTRYSGKAFKDSSKMKTAKLSTKEKRKLKKEKKKNKVQEKLSPTSQETILDEIYKQQLT